MSAPKIVGVLAFGLTLVAVPVSAQDVSAEVVVHSRPVSGRVVIGDVYSPHRHRRVVYRRAPVRRVVVVERDHHHHRHHHHHGRGRGHHKHHHHDWAGHGYRKVTIYYYDGRYYDGYDPRWRGVREVVVYERDGRYYRDRDGDERWGG